MKVTKGYILSHIYSYDLRKHTQQPDGILMAGWAHYKSHPSKAINKHQLQTVNGTVRHMVMRLCGLQSPKPCNYGFSVACT